MHTVTSRRLLRGLTERCDAPFRPVAVHDCSLVVCAHASYRLVAIQTAVRQSLLACRSLLSRGASAAAALRSAPLRSFAAAPAAAAAAAAPKAGPTFQYQDVFAPASKLDTPYKKLTGDFVRTVEVNGRSVLQVDPKALTLLANQVTTHARSANTRSWRRRGNWQLTRSSVSSMYCGPLQRRRAL